MEKLVKDYGFKIHNVDRNKKLRLTALMNILQDIADVHANELGVGLEYCLKSGITWFAANYHIIIERMPELNEKSQIATWASEQKKLFAIRDFAFYSEKNDIIMKATSQWMLIDINRKRPIPLKENLPDYTILSEKIMTSEFEKIANIDEVNFTKEFEVRFDDIDINNHVNNAIYLLWASETIGNDFRLNNAPCEIEISFKKECHYGETVIVSTELKKQTSTHIINSKLDDRELARVKINWKENI